jgi:hypothetical protein
MKGRRGRKRAQRRTRTVGRTEAQRDVADERVDGLEVGAEDDKGWRVGRAEAQRGAADERATSSCCTLEIGLQLETKVK